MHHPTRRLDHESDSVFYTNGFPVPEAHRACILPLTDDAASSFWKAAIAHRGKPQPGCLPSPHWANHAEVDGPDWRTQRANPNPPDLVVKFLALNLPWRDADVLFVVLDDHAVYECPWRVFKKHWRSFLEHEEALVVSPTDSLFVRFTADGRLFLGRRSHDSVISEFLLRVEHLPWFSKLGEQPLEGSKCTAIHSWDEWAGPESPSVAEIACRQHTLFDELTSDDDPALLADAWERVQNTVFRVAASRIPFDPRQDDWHPPNAAAWQAAWTAGLMGLCLYQGRSIPLELQTQWTWFSTGHWPCDWEGDFPSGNPVVL